MNPFQAIMGQMMPGGNTMPNAIPPSGGFAGMMQNVMQRAQQLAGQLCNPQQMVQRYFPDAPQEVQGDPDMLLNWLQQTGRVTPQMIQMARQLGGR